jgi:hypothetical protein
MYKLGKKKKTTRPTIEIKMLISTREEERIMAIVPLVERVKRPGDGMTRSSQGILTYLERVSIAYHQPPDKVTSTSYHIAYRNMEKL